MHWVYIFSVSVVCMYLRPHLDISSVVSDYVLVGGLLTLNVKKQLGLKFAHCSVPTPQAQNCCLSRAVSRKFRLQRSALMEERDRRGEREKVYEREKSGKVNEVEYAYMNSNKMLSLRQLHIYFLIHNQRCIVICCT